MKFFGLCSTADSEINTWIAARFEINCSRIDIFPFNRNKGLEKSG